MQNQMQTIESIAKSNTKETGIVNLVQINALKKPLQQTPRCKICEKLLIDEMKSKYTLFNAAYSVGHAAMQSWLYLALPKEDLYKEEDNAVRKCRTCEKVQYRKLRAQSPVFNSIYKVIDHTLENWLDKYLTDEDKQTAYLKDPAHAKELAQYKKAVA